MRTASVSRTIPRPLCGDFYFDHIENSIRAVFPLNKTLEFSIDEPKLSLSYKKKQFFDLALGDSDPTGPQDFLYISNVYAKDKNGLLQIDKNSLNEIEYSPNFHKKLVKVHNSEIQYKQVSDSDPLSQYLKVRQGQYYPIKWFG